MRVIKVYLNNEELDTVFWYGTRDTLDEIKEVLVDHDGYDLSIEVKEEIDEYVF